MVVTGFTILIHDDGNIEIASDLKMGDKELQKKPTLDDIEQGCRHAIEGILEMKIVEKVSARIMDMMNAMAVQQGTAQAQMSKINEKIQVARR